MFYPKAYEEWQKEILPLTEERRLEYDRAANFVTPLRSELVSQGVMRLLCSTEQGVVLVESAKHTGPHTGTRNCHNFHYYNLALYGTFQAALRQQKSPEAVSLILEDVRSPLPPAIFLRSRPSKRTVESTLNDYYTVYAGKTHAAKRLLDLVMDRRTEMVSFQSLRHG